MSMNRLTLDFLRPPRPSRRAEWVLLAVAVAFAADAGHSYLNLRKQIAQNETRLARLEHQSSKREGMLKIANAPVTEEEFALARNTIRRLSLPWNNLFAALDAAQTEGVALLAIEPDVEKATVEISGEAHSYLGVVSFVANLEQQKHLSGVHLVRHEIRHQVPRRPVAFVVSASWRDAK